MVQQMVVMMVRLKEPLKEILLVAHLVIVKEFELDCHLEQLMVHKLVMKMDLPVVMQLEK